MEVARNYCSTFHAGRTRQLRALRARADLARAAYLADPTSQPALDQLRHTAADLSSIANSRQPQMLSELGSCCMSTGISPPTTFTTCTGSGSKLPS